jgi:ribosomal protein S18 acetylase RimI-like enzyme
MAGLVLNPATDILLPLLNRDIGLHVYAIGDLDPFFAPFTTWFGWSDGAERERLSAAAVLYTPDPSTTPTLLALSMRPEPMRRLLDVIAGDLPPRMHAHLTPGLSDALGRQFVAETNEHHLKMFLPAEVTLPAWPLGRGERIAPITNTDLPEVRELYKAGYPDNWFDPRMLETQRYLGLWVAGVLAAIAGVHVYSRRYGVAALGNITTHPDYRARGYGRIVTAELCRVLREDHLKIGLNVHAGNHAAVRAYRSVGFVCVADYVESTLTRR